MVGWEWRIMKIKKIWSGEGLFSLVGDGNLEVDKMIHVGPIRTSVFDTHTLPTPSVLDFLCVWTFKLDYVLLLRLAVQS